MKKLNKVEMIQDNIHPFLMKESHAFFETLINPPAPSEELREALKRYKREVVDEKSRENKNI